MNPTRSKSALDDFKTPSFTKNQICSRYTHILERNVSMAVWSVVVAEYGEHPFERDTRCMGGHQNDRLLPVWVWIIRVGLAHDDVYLAARIPGTARPPFLNIIMTPSAPGEPFFWCKPTMGSKTYRSVKHPFIPFPPHR